MKLLRSETLNDVAELICGSDGGFGGRYKTPGQYRTKSQIGRFFENAGVVPVSEHSTRKWFALESLESINGTTDLESVLLQLASPFENKRDINLMRSVIDHLNGILQFECLEIQLQGYSPRLTTPKPIGLDVDLSTDNREQAPAFHDLVADESLAEINTSRWVEARDCQQAGAYLASIVMMGSVLESLLLDKVRANPAKANRSQKAPVWSDSGKVKQFRDWRFSELIEVARDLSWLESDVGKFGHVLRDFRNLIHTDGQRNQSFKASESVSRVCWEVVNVSIADLIDSS